MTSEQSKLWTLGQRVNWALPITASSMRPSGAHIAAVARTLGIKPGLARSALAFYIWN